MPTKTVIDGFTSQVTLEPLTAAELAQRETDRLAHVARKAEQDAIDVEFAKDKAALLTKLGITADEAKLLLS